jgi:signal transduction histidine kinase
VIHRESRKLTLLVDNVLDFSRMEAGRKEYRFETGNVADLVEEVVCGYDDHLRGAGFEMQLEVEPDLPPVTFDAAALSQALANLLDNSMKYSPDRKAIAVVVRRDESGVAIEVADRGIGIPRAEQQKIFEKFYRVDTEVVRTTRGSGLGLALTRHIVEAHGGRIVVDSTPGEGSRFRIVLPAVANVQQT